MINDPEIAGSFTDVHRQDVNLVLGVHHVDLKSALQFRNRPLGNQQSIVLRIELDPHPHELAGTKRIVGIWEKRLHPERPGG